MFQEAALRIPTKVNASWFLVRVHCFALTSFVDVSQPYSLARKSTALLIRCKGEASHVGEQMPILCAIWSFAHLFRTLVQCAQNNSPVSRVQDLFCQVHENNPLPWPATRSSTVYPAFAAAADPRHPRPRSSPCPGRRQEGSREERPEKAGTDWIEGQERGIFFVGWPAARPHHACAIEALIRPKKQEF